MKRALIHKLTNRFCQVVAQGEEFPVHADLEWRDCADEVTSETHDFDGSAFIAKPVPPVLTADELAALKVDGIDRLQFEIMFELENRTRLLELKTAITRATYRQALIDRWKQLHP